MGFRLWLFLLTQFSLKTLIFSKCYWRINTCQTLKCIEETNTIDFNKVDQNHTHSYEYGIYDYEDYVDPNVNPLKITDSTCLNLDISHSYITTITNATLNVHHPDEYKSIRIVDVNLSKIAPKAFEAFSNITRLILKRNRLEIVDLFFKITRLEELDLSYNALHEFKCQQEIRTLRTISLSNNRLTNLSLCNFPNLIQVKADSNNLTQVDFSCNTKLVSLNLASNRIQNLKASSFGNLTQMEILFLSNNSIESIFLGTFDRLISLRNLYLENNKIQTINMTTFVGLENLKSLNLDFNRITRIHTNSFCQLKSVTNLGLTHNQLNNIDPKGFTGLASLQELDLSRHTIFTISNDAFEGLTSLHKLDLSHSDVKHISNEAFFGIPNLRELNLNNNSFYVGSFLFADLKQLKKLDVKVIYNYGFIENAFYGLESVEELDLSALKIYKLHSGCFNGLDSLKMLNLSQNALKEIEAESFIGLPELIKLDLNGNNATFISPSAFLELNHLTYLNLGRNNLTKLIPYTFSGLDNLIFLDLSGSNISKIENYAFNGLFNLKKLTLSKNNLKNFDDSMFFHDLSSLEELDLSNNYFKVITGTTIVGLPNVQKINFGENEITTINVKAFSQLGSLKSLILAKNRIQWLGGKLFNDNLETLVLHQNVLKVLDNATFGNMKNLIELDVSNNLLDKFNPTVIRTTTLEILNLSHNRLTEIESKMLVKVFPNLRTLLINGNRFSCDSWQDILIGLDELEHLKVDAFANVTCMAGNSPFKPPNWPSNLERAVNETIENLKTVNNQTKMLTSNGFSLPKVSAANGFEILLIIICLIFCAMKLVDFVKEYLRRRRRKNRPSLLSSIHIDTSSVSLSDM